MNETIEYYNRNAEAYVQLTRKVDMTAIRDRFMDLVPAGGNILDLGSGSGRDSKAFLDRGYHVTAVDGSAEMCRATEQFAGLKAICADFTAFTPDHHFHGIWANASLLHLPAQTIHHVVQRLSSYLFSGGVFFMSFKYGDFAGRRDDRYYTYLTEPLLQDLLRDIDELSAHEFFRTGDTIPGREDLVWLNAIYVKK